MHYGDFSVHIINCESTTETLLEMVKYDSFAHLHTKCVCIAATFYWSFCVNGSKFSFTSRVIFVTSFSL